MDKTRLYRTLFLIDDTRNYTNSFYVSEFVKIILFQEGYFTLSIEEIQKKIEDLTSLEYTLEDIIHSISVWNNNEIECKSGNYSLTSAGVERISKREKFNDIKVYIDLFMKTYPDKVDIKKEDFEELIGKFIYQRFNENLQQISDIFNHCLNTDSHKNDYSESEGHLINEFLNWDHPEKNKCVYNLIAKSYDYCMINSKCEDSIIDFSKIYFYLDTNIIFRLMGINGAYRESSIQNLIEKSRSVGINLVVSNYVKEECEFTINSQLQILISTTTNMNSLIPPSSMGFAEEKSIRLDFYTRYYDWVRAGNKHRNYDSFKKCILRDFHKLIDSFNKDNNNPSFKIQKGPEFEKFYNSLYEQKIDKHTTETDINSLFLLLEKRNHNSDLEYFLISADQKLISWLREIFPGQKSLADFPSAWLSIILKYTGREKDSDYKAFCQFIHLSIEPKIEDLEKKIEIKAGILGSDLEDNMKTMMIEEVKENYNQYKDYDTDDVLRIAFGKTKKQIESEIEQKKNSEKDLAIAKLKNVFNRKNTESQETIKRITEEAEKAKQSEYQRGCIETEERMKKEAFEKKVKTKIQRNKRIRKFFTILLWVFLFICVLTWVLFYLKGYLKSQSPIAVFLKNNSLFISGFSTLIELCVFAFNITIGKTNILSIDENFIRNKEKNK